MVCNENPLSSVMNTFARQHSGLEASQIQGLSHALLREYRAGAHDENAHTAQQQWAEFIETVEAKYDAGELDVRPGSSAPRMRLEKAKQLSADPARLYAAQKLLDYAVAAKNAETAYVEDFARSIGAPWSSAHSEYERAFNAARDNRKLTATTAFVKEWQSNPANTGMPVDRCTLYAIEQLENTRAARQMAHEQRRAVQRTPAIEAFTHPTGLFTEAGFDPINGRIELKRVDSPKTFAYRMTETDWEAFRNAADPDSYYHTHVRGNPDHQYRTIDEVKTAAYHNRCPSCFQFANMSNHYCPVVAGEEHYNRDVRLISERARLNAAGQPARYDNIPNVPKLPANQQKTYPLDDVTLTAPPITTLRQEVLQKGSLAAPVHATFHEGNATVRVDGHVIVEKQGRGAGYTAEPFDAPGDHPRDQLKCSCRQYREKYYCPHIADTAERVSSLLNGATPLRASLIDLNETLTETHDFAEAMRARTLQRVTGTPPVVNYSSDYDAFHQTMRTVRNQPLPYRKETGSLGGLFTRESGRGFGVELEYSFPSTMSADQVREAREAIGRDLYELGLTDTIEQKGFGATKDQENVPDYNERGWSYESDPTTENPSLGAVAGGELRSPILFDENETWEALDKATSVIAKHGGVASKTCATHIHVGLGDYDHAVENYNRLLSMHSEFEDVLFRLSTDPDRRSHRGVIHCQGNPTPSTPYTTFDTVRNVNTGQDVAVNLSYADGSETGHAEFRTPDATLNPAVIQARVAAFGGLVEAAVAGKTNPAPGRNVERVGSRYAKSADDPQSDTASFRRFLDTITPRGEGGEDVAEQVCGLFAKTDWQPPLVGHAS